MQHGLPGGSGEDVQPVHAPGRHARSRVEGAAKIIPVAPPWDRLWTGVDGVTHRGDSLDGTESGGTAVARASWTRDQEETGTCEQ